MRRRGLRVRLLVSAVTAGVLVVAAGGPEARAETSPLRLATVARSTEAAVTARMGGSATTVDSGDRSVFRVSGVIEPDGLPSFPGDELATSATTLANGMALLFGRVSRETERIVLHFAGGRTQRLIPRNRTFAIALEASEIVDEIVPEAPNQDIRCSLEEALGGYSCSGPTEYESTTDPIPPIPGSISTAPPPPG